MGEDELLVGVALRGVVKTVQVEYCVEEIGLDCFSNKRHK